jgi:uncharacterized protein (DUF1697 family)
MNKYVAFLRAINVGGHSIIRMADLKQMFESAGLDNVQTYIQSGNVIFESDEKDSDILEKRIEGQLEENTGSKVQVFVRKMQEVQSIASQAPFTATDGETAYVAFLSQKSDKNAEQALLALKSGADDFAIKGREIYVLRRDREKSVFSTNFLERILRMPTTTRNLMVIKKIAEKYK